ncbi:SusC/RagA family TonB-linked outer membrane protein [Sphingobacterium olei]|uniref:SusC/RagA family TonB-linked outer membrane protein n=1 Tax=Sphingobacterium olei TaxID=2571155 RepID=A0A4U0P6T6_9SPHI|nr:SusC/RagA family TonB-linked outer membrane protein [Sphingobacterium olei]TJZ63010.1 SusC/RagA family TonB-linked outer membrane protein [Sphingobacterium olei]
MIRLLAILFGGCLSLSYASGQSISGTVISDKTDLPIEYASLRWQASGTESSSDADGDFQVPFFNADSLIISAIGYLTKTIYVARAQSDLKITLVADEKAIEVVEISTGYYRLPKERATGSFVHIDNTLLDRNPSPNILQRLEGVASGVQFVNAGGNSSNDIRVRGLSTIESNAQPLIILDNFPYEGDLNNIDPNDIEDITILKDAAAASIWGAMAGNGVIVINSKQAKLNGRVNINLNANTGFSERPDLTYSMAWLPSDIVMDIEKQRYEEALYNIADHVTVPYYVDLLDEQKNGRISLEELRMGEERLRNTDTRLQAMKHLYRSGFNGQYGLNVSGGAGMHNYKLSFGLWDNKSEVIGNDSKRVNFSIVNRFAPTRAIDLGLGFTYVHNGNISNGVSYNDLTGNYAGYPSISPYIQLSDDGIAQSIVKDVKYSYARVAENEGLLDWLYRPLEERSLVNNTSYGREYRINADVGVKPLTGLEIRANYQLVQGNSKSNTHYLKDSYYVRNLVNSYTQANGSFIIPNNGIYREGNPEDRFSHFGRLQVNYAGTYDERHKLNTLAGMEIRHSQAEIFPGMVLYNYHDDYLTGSNQYNFNQSYPTRPTGAPSRFIPGASAIRKKLTNRDLSYYGNMSYDYNSRYIVSGSIRWDASNLFGVKTNDKGVPLWSIGGSWNISNEDFFDLEHILPYLRLRTTYGRSGNVNKSVTHYPTVRFTTSALGQPAATVLSVGNPSLRWEKVYTWNSGLDWKMFGAKLSGSIEYYIKDGNDLIGDQFMDPTTGVDEAYKINYADIQSKGWDIQVSTQHAWHNINWKVDVLSSWVKNKIKNYATNEATRVSNYYNPSVPPEIGRSKDVIYSLPWHGLSNEGLPIIYIDDELSKNYSEFSNVHLKKEMLIDAGVTVPTFYGSVRNTLGWKNFQLSFLVTWKGGNVFRRSSMEPDGENRAAYHMDYFDRWRQEGDELITQVPRRINANEMTAADISAAATYYRVSQQLITKADLIRLQDIGLNYQIDKSFIRGTPIKGVTISGFATNLGLLWKSTKYPIDPDFRNSIFVPVRQFNLGIKVLL